MRRNIGVLPGMSGIYLAPSKGGGGDDTVGNIIVGQSPSNSSATMVRDDPEGDSLGSARSRIVAHPLDSNRMEEVLGYLRMLPTAIKTYPPRKLTNLAKRLITLATRTPWVDHPVLSAEPGYAEQWQSEIPARAAFYFPKAVAAAAHHSSVVCISTFLENRCDDIYDNKALLFMFAGCIPYLPQEEQASPIAKLLSVMVIRPDIRKVDKLTSGGLEVVRRALEGLPRDQFAEVYRGLRQVVNKVSKREPKSQSARNFLLGVCDLYFAPSDEILT